MARQLIHTRWSFNISLYVNSIFLLTFMLQSWGEYDLWDLSQEHFLDQNTWRSTKFVNKLSLSGTEQPASYSLTICSPKNIICAIIYSPSWYSKPVYVSFLCLKEIWRTKKWFVPIDFQTFIVGIGIPWKSMGTIKCLIQHSSKYTILCSI